MFFLSCGALSRPFSLVFVKTLPKEERPSRKRKKEEYNKKRRERSGEIVKGMSSIYRKILGYYSTIHLPFYPYFTISSTHTITPTHTITSTLTPTHTITSTLTPTHTITSTLTPTYYYIILLHLPLNLPILLHLPIHLPILLLQLPFTITLFNNYHYLITTLHNTINSLKKLIE
jgi:hypothetical protein